MLQSMPFRRRDALVEFREALDILGEDPGAHISTSVLADRGYKIMTEGKQVVKTLEVAEPGLSLRGYVDYQPETLCECLKI